MIPIYLCDDESHILQALKQKLENILLIEACDMEIRLASPSPEAILDAVQSNQSRGVYFLDVDLKHPQYNGFTLAARLRELDPRGFLIFVTTHQELALETFHYRLEAMDYILKDDPTDLTRRLKQCLSSIQARLAQEKNRETTDQLTVKVFDQLHHFPLAQVLYIETSAKKHRLLLHTDNTILEFFDNLQNLQDQLGDKFWRCHRSCLVNRRRLTRVLNKENLVELDNGETLPLSRQAKKEQ